MCVLILSVVAAGLAIITPNHAPRLLQPPPRPRVLIGDGAKGLAAVASSKFVYARWVDSAGVMSGTARRRGETVVAVKVSIFSDNRNIDVGMMAEV